jgi:hypothetical protein
MVSLLKMASSQKTGAARGALAFATVAGCAVLTLAGCAQEPLKPVVIPPQAAAPPPVTLSGKVVEAASEYHVYVQRASQIRPSFTTGPQIEASLSMGEDYEAQQLSRGIIAYGALVALQDPNFVASVRTYAVDPDGRRSLAAKLVSDPAYAAALPNAPSAAGLIISTLTADSAKMRGAGEMVKQFAYDVQHQAWSKKDVTDPVGRLATAKQVSSAPMTPVPADVDQLMGAVTGPDSKVASRAMLVSGQASGPPYTPVVTRALAVAALAALGEGGDANDAQVESLLNESSGGFCLNMSKLNLYQCLAVAKPWYEDVFCLGQHVLIDTGQCVAKEVGPMQPVQAVAAPTSNTGGAAAPGRAPGVSQ